MSNFEKKYNILKTQAAIDKVDEKDINESLIWYHKTITNLKFKLTPKQLIENQKNIRKVIRYGQMYHFLYLPKKRDELPYYDRFPLVFPIQRSGNGFLGINLHYLDYQNRLKFMRNLYTFQLNTSVEETTKLMLTYRLLNKTRSLKYFKPCIKRYLYSHIKSNFLKIDYDDWNIAIFLPTEQFAKLNKEAVWKDSLGKL